MEHLLAGAECGESLARGKTFPDFAEFTIGPAKGGTRRLHPGYVGFVSAQPILRGGRTVG